MSGRTIGRSEVRSFLAVIAIAGAMLFGVAYQRIVGEIAREEGIPATAEKSGVHAAVADLQPLDGGRVVGTLRFRVAAEGGVALRFRLKSLPPGHHAIHVRELGDCSSREGVSTGSNLAHVGDLAAGPWGRAEGQQHVPFLELASLLGKSVVIMTSDGGSPRPLACGVAAPRYAQI